MRREKQRRDLTRISIAVAWVIMALSVAAQENSELIENLHACQAIADAELRLACYDELVKVQSRTPAPVEAMNSSPAQAAPEPADTPPAAAAVAASADAAASTAAPTPKPIDNPPEGALTAKQEPQSVPLTDDVGSWSGQIGNEDTQPIRATVTRCSQNSMDDYFFHFENGQVWKYKGRRRLWYKECSFDVTITRDFFGYKMQPEGEDRTLRISRVD